MKTKFFAIAVFFALAILLSGCLSDRQILGGIEDENKTQGNADTNQGIDLNTGIEVLPPKIDVAERVSLCETLTGTDAKDRCFSELALEAKTDGPCDLVKGGTKDVCFQRIAIALLDEGPCSKIIEPLTRDGCYNTVALSAGNSGPCRQIGNQQAKETCYETIAVQNKKPEACRNIAEQARRDNCYISIARVSTDRSFCENVSTLRGANGIKRDECYMIGGVKILGEDCRFIVGQETRADCFAVADNTPARIIDCDQFSDEGSVNNCKIWFGIYTGSPLACYSVKYEDIQTCLAEAIKHQPSIVKCNDIRDEDFEVRNECYRNVALENNDSALCETISSDTKLKIECRMELAIRNNDTNTCFGIPGNFIAERDSCISQIAFNQQSMGLCNEMTTDKGYRNCVSEIALSSFNPGLCEGAERQNFKLLAYTGREYCYFDYAVKLEDAAFCENIRFQKLKEECQTEVLRAITCVTGDGQCDRALCKYEIDRDCPKVT